jgi:CheY-like chemotaxis protein
MSEAGIRCETGRPTLHCFRPTAIRPGEMVAGYAGALGLAPDQTTATPLEPCSARELRTPRVTRADHAMARLLLIGDGLALIAVQLRPAFPAPTHQVQVADTIPFGLEQVRTNPPDVIVLDLGPPDQSGLEVYQQIRRMNWRLPVIVIAQSKRADAAIEPIKHGAYDCLFRPLDLSVLRRVVAEALGVARRMRQPAVSEESGTDPDAGTAIVGSCPAMNEVYKAIGSALGVGMFLTTLSFLVTTPGVWAAAAGGFPALSGSPGQFLIKDLALLEISLWSLGESWQAIQQASFPRERGEELR